MKHFFLSLFLFCFCTLVSSAQRYEFKKYKVEEGLVNNETFAILQDSKKRIWISTTGGVSCFNGSTFKTYTTEDGLPSNIVFSVFEDSKGRIWFGTLDKGVSFLENGKIINPVGVDFDYLGSANHIIEGGDGTLYIIFSKGIVVYKNQKLEYLLKGSAENGILAVQKAAWFDDNTLFLASSDKGIFKMTLNPLSIENVYNEADGINNICYSVLVDSKKNVWVGGYGGLYKIAEGELSIFNFNPADFDKNRVYGILEKNETELLLSFEGNGFGIFNKTTGQIKIINDSHGLPSPFIYQMIKDTEGNYWMTSFGEGVIRFRDTAFKIYDASQGLPSNSVNDVAEWNGALLLATNDGIFSLGKNGEIQKRISGGKVMKLLVNPENNLLFTTETAVYKMDAPNDKPRIIDEGAYTLLYAEQNKTMLFGTDKIKVLASDSTYFIKSRRSITMAPIGDRYIFCKIGGLFQLKGNDIDTIPGLDPKKHNDFRSLDALNPNELLAANEKKLYHIALREGKYSIQTFDMARFPGLKHFRALKVDGNDLWLGGRDVLLKINLELLLKRDSIVQKRFPTIAHFLENDIDFNSLYITKDNTILATSLSGMLAFNEAEYLPNRQPPSLDLSEISLFSEPLNDSLYRTENGIVLPHQKNYLTFTMEAITFTNPENVKFKYRMKGLRDGDEWSKPTKDATVVFSYLPPGDYTFEFTADNGNGIWQQQPLQYSFVITVPFWKTGLFWVLLVAFSSFGIFLLYYLRNRAIQKRNEIYTHNLIKAQEAERTRVARELHDSVGQKLMLLTKKTKSTGQAEMESLASNTLEELRAISRGLHPSILERLGPTAAIRNMVDEVDANTTIFFTHEIDDIDALLPREAALHLYRIIQEVLNNMIKHSEAKAASVIIEKKTNAIEATVTDNGKGFEISEKTKAHDSLGMKTLLERAKILRSKIDIKSQPNKGTIITLIIPL